MKKIVIIFLIAMIKLNSIENDIILKDTELSNMYQNRKGLSLSRYSLCFEKSFEQNKDAQSSEKTIDFENSAFAFKPSALLSSFSFLDSFAKNCRTNSARNNEMINSF